MARIVPKITLPILLLVAGLLPLSAQVFPGDANNDGRVDQYDILAVGYAYGAVGPARIAPGTNTELQGPALLWPADFPAGDNFAYADANGNGQIEITDFATIYSNYGTQWQTNVVPPVSSPVDDPAPRLGIGTENESHTLSGGQGLALPILLGSADHPLNNLNGIAFRISYQQAHFASVQLTLANNWLSQGIGQTFNFQHVAAEGKDVAITRFGMSPVTGSGEIGNLSLVIIGDMIDLLPNPWDTIQTCVYIEGVLAIDVQYDTIPVWADSICLDLYDVDAVLADRDLADDHSIGIWPNPTKGRLSLASAIAFDRLELVDMRGASWLLYAGAAVEEWQGHLPDLPPGCYAVRIYCRDRVRLRRVMIL